MKSQDGDDGGRVVGVLGARSLVGAELTALLTSTPAVRLRRFTRKPLKDLPDGSDWETFHDPQPGDVVSTFVSLMPIWALTEKLSWLTAFGCRRLVALSSTSRFTKAESERPADRELARRLETAEDDMLAWARQTGVSITILRPTMIYGSVDDGNVSTIAATLRRWRMFPVVGRAEGLRQPVHAADVAWAVARVAAADGADLSSAYDLSGGETLSYRELVERVRSTVTGPTAVVAVPDGVFRTVARLAPRSRTAATAAGMASRMGQDMVFDHTAASRDFGFSPRGFVPGLDLSADRSPE